jgi:alkanesulfonate monooxygenase SsuD/methylene tetrahydromethanopterin reductase-like flavin-dependent oxidoreductase (luciferase family)
MKLGVLINHINQPLGEVIEQARLAEKYGADSIWLTQTAGQREIGMLLSALAANTENVQLGMAVQPIYVHPPVVTAQTALTLDELSGGRLVLGLGVGHRVMGEWMMGASYTPQAAAMREYLAIVRSLSTEGQVNFTGRWYGAAPPGPAAVPGRAGSPHAGAGRGGGGRGGRVHVLGRLPARAGDAQAACGLGPAPGRASRRFRRGGHAL